MKKITSALLIIIICLGLLVVFTLFYLKDLGKQNNFKNDKDNVDAVAKNKLFDQLTTWSMDIYQSNNYDNCVDQEDGTCFISLDSLEKDYGKDISIFKEKGAECSISLSGLSINLNNSSEPFSIILGGCKYNNSKNNS